MGGELCPEGWRIPTAEEWALLKVFHTNDLKNLDFWLSNNNYTNSTNFNLCASGYYNDSTKRFEELYGYAAFWSFETSSSTLIPGACFSHTCPYVEIKDIRRTDAVSVRCVSMD